MVERFPTILRDKDHMILAVPLGMTESFAVWHDKLPLGGTLSGSPKGVCRLDSRNCQTLGVPRQSRGFTMIKLCALSLQDTTRLQRITQVRGRIILALDGLQPDVGHEVLWVLRDCLSGEILLARSLLSATQDDL